MAYSIDKNIVDIKKEYTDCVVSIISPRIYEGFKSMYAKAVSTEQKYIAASKTNDKLVNPGVLAIFQYFIKGLEKLNDNIIEAEMIRIRDSSKCADYFDDLIKATIKSNIMLLTHGAANNNKFVLDKYHEKVNIKSLIHKCYLECGKIFYTHSNLFWHKFKSTEIQHNQSVILQLIRIGILKAIRGALPMKEILKEFLSNDYRNVSPANYSQNNTNNMHKILDSADQEDGLNNDSLNNDGLNNDNLRPSILLSENQLYEPVSGVGYMQGGALYDNMQQEQDQEQDGDQDQDRDRNQDRNQDQKSERQQSDKDSKYANTSEDEGTMNNFSESSEQSEPVKQTFKGGSRKNKNDNIILDAIEKSQLANNKNMDKKLTDIINN